METKHNKKEILVLRVYSILILIYAVFDIMTAILPKFQIVTIKSNVPHQLFLYLYRDCPLYHPNQYYRRIRLTAKKILGQIWRHCSHADISYYILTQFLWWGA